MDKIFRNIIIILLGLTVFFYIFKPAIKKKDCDLQPVQDSISALSVKLDSIRKNTDSLMLKSNRILKQIDSLQNKMNEQKALLNHIDSVLHAERNINISLF
jgi:uncharacterized protein YoxC